MTVNCGNNVESWVVIVVCLIKGRWIWPCSPLSSGSVLLQQTDHIGRTALDLVFTADQREELHRSAQVGDSALTSKATKVFNLPLLEAGSVLLAHFISSYLRERGLHSNMQANNNVHRLIRSLETHSFQRVTLGWTDQRAVRMVEDVETLLEIGRGRYLGHIPQSVKECKGENTMFLMEMMGNLKMQAEALATDVWWAQLMGMFVSCMCIFITLRLNFLLQCIATISEIVNVCFKPHDATLTFL